MSYRIWDEEPTRRISALENPEEHEHSVLTRRAVVAVPIVADAAASAPPRPARQRRRVRSGRPASRMGPGPPVGRAPSRPSHRGGVRVCAGAAVAARRRPPTAAQWRRDALSFVV